LTPLNATHALSLPVSIFGPRGAQTGKHPLPQKTFLCYRPLVHTDIVEWTHEDIVVYRPIERASEDKREMNGLGTGGRPTNEIPLHISHRQLAVLIYHRSTQYNAVYNTPTSQFIHVSVITGLTLFHSNYNFHVLVTTAINARLKSNHTTLINNLFTSKISTMFCNQH